MFKSPSWYLAWRYLQPKRSFVSVITFLSVLGPIIGVAVLIIVIAVMAGFNRDIREKILGMHAHIQLKSIFNTPIDNPDVLIAKLTQLGVHATPVVEGPVLMQTPKHVLAMYIKGIDPAREKQVSDLARYLLEGKFTISDDEVLIGADLAANSGLKIGDKFLLHSPDKLNKMVQFNDDGSIQTKPEQEVYLPEEVTVAGIFSLGMYEYDASLIVMTIDKAAQLYGYDWGSASNIQIRTADPFALDATVEKIKKDPVFDGVYSLTWKQSNQHFFGALQVEKNLMFFLLIFIMIVAAFGITATLITVVVQKTVEIGVLKALGATPGTILLIFIYQGLVVGLLGITLGTVLGLAVLHFRDRIADLMAYLSGLEIFPKDLYHLERIPALVQPVDIIIILVSALTICILAAMIPAFYAASLTPAEALGHEV